MSQSPEDDARMPGEDYLDAWQELATRIRQGNSFSGREPNSCFLNTAGGGHGGRFADMSWLSGCGLIDDGRALAVTDWDGDGDLDLWFTNRTAPRVRFLRNDFAQMGNHLLVRLQGDPGRRCPRDAIGAQVEAALDDGRKLTKILSAGNGFLSQSTKWIHFGLGDAKTVESVQVTWPGSAQPESFGPVKSNQSIHLIQGSGQAAVVPSPRHAALSPKPFSPPAVDGSSRVVLRQPAEVPPLTYRQDTGENVVLPADGSVLMVLWASWCQPCLLELAELVKSRSRIEGSGLHLVAINIEGAQEGSGTTAGDWTGVLAKLKWPFASGIADAALLETIEAVRHRHVYKLEPLPLPSSVLFHQGRLVSFEKGAIQLDTVLAEVTRLKQAATPFDDHAVGLPGRWSTQYFVSHPVAVAKVYLEDGYTEDARKYLQKSLNELDTPDPRKRRFQEADIHFMLGEVDRLEKKPLTAVIAHYETGYKKNPDHPGIAVSLGRAYTLSKQGQRAIPILKAFIESNPKRPDAWHQLGEAFQSEKVRDWTNATGAYEKALALNPKQTASANQLCWIYATAPRDELRNVERGLHLANELLQSGAARRPQIADTVAAALANAGRFDEAVRVIDHAIVLAKGQANSPLVSRLENRKKLYAAGKPFRSSADPDA